MHEHTISFDGQAGLVTGAAGGIGRATAIAFARSGADVVVSDLESSRAQALETVRMAEDAGGKALFVPADVTDAQSIRALVDATVAQFGRLDFAHNNAGIGAAAFTADHTEDQWDQIMAVNLKGVWLSMKYELDHMTRNGGGTIVNSASLSGLMGGPLTAAYVASKHGVVGLTKTAASEYINQGVRINAVAPGAVETPMVADLDDSTRAMLLSSQPLQRFASPEEIAEAVIWLASDKSSFVVGAIVSIDGGAATSGQSYNPFTSPGPVEES